MARTIAKQVGEPPGLAYLEGLIALADKEGAKAARHLAKALKATPDAPAAAAGDGAGTGVAEPRRPKPKSIYRRLIITAPTAEAGKIELAALLIKRGIARRDKTELGMAAALFGEAASFDPRSELAYVLLGETREKLGAKSESIDAYRHALSLDSEDKHGAALALARLGDAAAPSHAPEAFVRRLFDDYADGFDASLVERLHYRAPALLLKAIQRTLGDGPFDIFDAGCGTGLMGVALKRLAPAVGWGGSQPAHGREGAGARHL